MQQNSRPPPIPLSLISFSRSLLSSLHPSSHSSPKAPISCTLSLFIILFPLYLISVLLFTGSLSFTLSISLLPRGPCFLACITHNYFHPSIICLLLFSLPTSLSLLYDNNPHYPAYTSFFATPMPHLPPLGATECTSPHSCPPSPSSLFSSLKAHPSCSCLSYQMSLKFG